MIQITNEESLEKKVHICYEAEMLSHRSIQIHTEIIIEF